MRPKTVTTWLWKQWKDKPNRKRKSGKPSRTKCFYLSKLACSSRSSFVYYELEPSQKQAKYILAFTERKYQQEKSNCMFNVCALFYQQQIFAGRYETFQYFDFACKLVLVVSTTQIVVASSFAIVYCKLFCGQVGFTLLAQKSQYAQYQLLSRGESGRLTMLQQLDYCMVGQTSQTRSTVGYRQTRLASYFQLVSTTRLVYRTSQYSSQIASYCSYCSQLVDYYCTKPSSLLQYDRTAASLTIGSHNCHCMDSALQHCNSNCTDSNRRLYRTVIST